jgi:hypothetical protein
MVKMHFLAPQITHTLPAIAALTATQPLIGSITFTSFAAF